MTNLDNEKVCVREAHVLAKELTRSEIPAIRALAVHVLAATRLMLSEICPDEFEHVSEYEDLI